MKSFACHGQIILFVGVILQRQSLQGVPVGRYSPTSRDRLAAINLRSLFCKLTGSMDNNESTASATPGVIKRPTHRVTSVRLLVAGAFGLLLYFAHVAFIPVALALLFSLILSAPVEALHGMRVPRSISAALIMAAILGTLVALGNFVSEPAQQWYAAAPHTVRLIEKKIRPFAQVMARVGELRNSAGNIGAIGVGGAVPATIAPKESAPVMLLDATRSAVLSCATVVILTLFLLAGGPPMMARLTSALASDLES